MTQISSTYGRFLGTTHQLGGLNNRLFELQQQVASGKKPGGLVGVAADSGRLLQSQEVQARLESYQRSLNVIDQRSEIYQAALGQLSAIASDARSDLLRFGSDPTAHGALLITRIDAWLDEIEAALNAQDGKHYLFSGPQHDTLPVVKLRDLPLTPLPFDATDPLVGPGTSPAYANPVIDENSLWERAGLHVGETERLDYGIHAGEPAIQQLVAGLLYAKAALSEAPPPDEPADAFATAHEWMQEAVEGLAGLEARNGFTREAVSHRREAHEASIDQLTRTVGAIEDADMAKVASELSLTQTVLQASYRATGQILQLSLASFLR